MENKRMKAWRSAPVVGVLMLLSGCSVAPLIEHVTVDESSAPLRAAVLVVPGGSASGQAISARSCKKLAWEPDATAEDGIEQLKVKASRLGANAIAGVACEPESPNASMSANCWTAVVCRATALSTK